MVAALLGISVVPTTGANGFLEDASDECKQMLATVGLVYYEPPPIRRHHSFRIGQAKFELTPQMIRIGNSGATVEIDLSESFMSYQAIVESPYVEYYGFDGNVIPVCSKGLREVSDELTAENFPRFAFFGDRPTTIGIMTGGAGAAGGSGQRLNFFDTESDRHLKIRTGDYGDPVWVRDDRNPDGRPLGYCDTRMDYFSTYREYTGHRVDQCYDLLVWEAQEPKPSLAMTETAMRRRLESNLVSDADLAEIQSSGESYRPNMELAHRMLDYVYYGTRLGKQEAVKTALGEWFSPEPGFFQRIKVWLLGDDTTRTLTDGWMWKRQRLQTMAECLPTLYDDWDRPERGWSDEERACRNARDTDE